MKRVSLVASALIAAPLSISTAAAQSCGATLVSDTVLTADVVCPPYAPFALKIAAPGVQLDLNGYAIVLPVPAIGGFSCPNSRSVAIVVDGVEKVHVHSGRIENSGDCPLVGAQFNGSNRGAVTSVTFTGPGAAVYLAGSSEATISANTFETSTGVAIGRDPLNPRRPAAANRVVGNYMPQARAGFTQSAFISGFDADAGTVIEHNKVERTGIGIFLGPRSHRATIVGNALLDGYPLYSFTMNAQISVLGANQVLIADNWAAGNMLGLRLEGSNHRVVNNYFAGFSAAIEIGSYVGTPSSSNNLVNANQLESLGSGVGLFFNTSAMNNNGRSNTYLHVSTPVVDNGTGNIY
jgi:hypothetical protein